MIGLLFFGEGTFRLKERETPDHAVLVGLAMFLLVVAEANVLTALYRRENLEGLHLDVVFFALFWGFSTLALTPVTARVVAALASGRVRRRDVNAASVWFGIVGTVAVVVAAIVGADLLDVLTALAFFSVPTIGFSYFHYRQWRQAKADDDRERSERFRKRFRGRDRDI